MIAGATAAFQLVKESAEAADAAFKGLSGAMKLLCDMGRLLDKERGRLRYRRRYVRRGLALRRGR